MAPRSIGGLAREVGGTLASYVVGQLVVSGLLTVLYAIGFALAGLPFWFLLAPLCGFLNVIPHFGPLIALGAGFLVALVARFDWTHLAILMGVYLIVFTLEGYVLTPLILGRRLRLRPLYVFLAVVAGGSMFGLLGLVLAVPALAVAAVVYRYFQRPPETPQVPPS
ncbi:MAG TPA: AI-2E family transporter [Bryobacteraceae bacterium]|nr:AI-2E family transporter [Bryobacteraceae bacterium]